MIITMADVRAAKMCSKGTRRFFIKHGFDWSNFLKNGIDARELENTGDAMALKLVRVAHGRKQ